MNLNKSELENAEERIELLKVSEVLWLPRQLCRVLMI